MYTDSQVALTAKARIARSAPVGEVELFAGCQGLIGVVSRYPRDEEIYGEAEEAEFTYKVISGAVRTYKILDDGRRQIAAFHLPGDLFGLESGGRHTLTAEAVADTTLAVYKRRQIDALSEHNVDLACQLWRLTAANLGHAESHMLLLGRKCALERVAAFLVEMEQRIGDQGALELPMSRRDIADYLGLTLETVSRAFSQLQSNGTLELSGARRVRLLRRKALADLGGAG